MLMPNRSAAATGATPQPEIRYPAGGGEPPGTPAPELPARPESPPRPEIPARPESMPRPEIPARPETPEIPAKPYRDVPQPDRERAERTR